MPTDPSILGFTNLWYPAVCATATPVELEPGVSIRLVTPPLFLATKIEAFRGRGRGDLFGSHDLEDIVAVIDGRPELAAEIGASPPDVRFYLAEARRDLLARPRFRDAVQGHLPSDAVSQARSQIVLDRIGEICRAVARP